MSKGTDANPMNDYKAKIEAITHELRRSVQRDPVSTVSTDQATASLLQLLTEARRDTLNKVREQANGSYEIRTTKEPANMIWEIAEWQLRDIEAELKGEK